MGVIISKIKNHFECKKIQNEGGEPTSQFLRDITEHRNKVRVGMHSYGSCFAKEFNLGGTVVIGRYTSFGPNVRYFGANHPYRCATMSPYFYQQAWADKFKCEVKVADIERYQLEVGNDCWIGYGTIITSKCKTIGNGAVIGAGSIVTKDVLPYSIVAGNPAKILGYRFDAQTIKLLEDSKWYELNPKELLEYYDLHSQPEKFAIAIIEYRRQKKG